MSRSVRVLATLVVTGFAIAYLLWKVDLSETVDVLAEVHAGYFLLTIAIFVVTVPPMAWRWKLLLAAKGMSERLGWLTRAYFTGYAAGQILPTGVGGDALRIFETSRRHPGRTGAIAATVLLERAIGGAATLALGALGFALALGTYDVGAYLWLEGILVAATILLGVVLFSRAARRPLRRVAPILARVRLDRPLRAVYEGMHSYRANAGLLVFVFAFTLVVQAVRILGVWTSAKAVGIDLSPRVYFVMGPLLFLVMLVPFTLNGFAVREAFFVSFLGQLGVDADAAFAAGFLFFVVTLIAALPGVLILAWENLRPRAPGRQPSRPAEPASGPPAAAGGSGLSGAVPSTVPSGPAPPATAQEREGDPNG
jgi:uncharacterized protein (TIRG00374 family)